MERYTERDINGVAHIMNGTCEVVLDDNGDVNITTGGGAAGGPIDHEAMKRAGAYSPQEGCYIIVENKSQKEGQTT